MAFQMETLGYGAFLGRPVRRLEGPLVVLSESSYEPGCVLPRHRHGHAGFRLTLEGAFLEQQGGEERSFGRGALGFHAPEVPHAQRFGSVRTRCFNIDFSAEGWRRGADAVAPLLEGRAPDSPEARAVALRLYREFKRPDDLSSMAIEGLALELLVASVRALRRGDGQSPPRWLLRARELLESSLTAPPTLASLAVRVGVSPERLTRAFRRHFRATPAEHLRALRLERACRALRETDEPLGAIAMAAGYCDQSHFNRELRRALQLTPAEYRAVARGRRFDPRTSVRSKTRD